jgi:hypothetical protein
MLTEEEKFLIGCVLGDGTLNRRHKYKNVCSIKITHCKAQLLYLKWKVQRLQPILKSKAKILKGYNNFGFEYFSWESGFSSYVHIYNMIYMNQKKTFSFDLLKHLGPKELAIFWCDDGGIVKSLRKKSNPKTNKPYPNLLQETQGNLAVYESKQETDSVASWIQDLTGEKPSVRLHKKTGLYYLRFNKKQLTALVFCIEKHTPSCMLNKIDLSLIPLNKRNEIKQKRAEKRQECAAT